MNRQLRRERQFELRRLKLVPCDFKLTAAAGLGTVLEVFDQSPMAKEFRKCLPERVSPRSVGSYMLGLMGVAAHIHEAETLSDIAKIKGDPALEVLFDDDVAASRTMGDYLRDFEDEHLGGLNLFLSRMSKAIFLHLQAIQPDEHKPQKFIIDMDSTSHVHYGETIEGLAYNYKSEWCLDSQVSFSSVGLCHGLQLRPGNTKSGVDAPDLIRQSFRDGKNQRDRRLKGEDYFRADSAYCNQDVIKTCLGLGVLFTLTAHDGTTGWKTLMDQEGLVWEPWRYSDAEIKRAEKCSETLPKVELARMHWRPSWSEGKLVFPIVIKRTWQKEKPEDKRGQRNLFYIDSIEERGEWVYYGVVTNWDLSGTTLQEVMEHHNKRGNAENFIKEEKYNYKLKSFPCRSLKANHAWALLAQVAHNLLRWMALIERPDKPHYSKKLRRRYVFHPGRVVRHARTVVLKVMRPFYEEVQKMREAWQATPIPALNTS